MITNCVECNWNVQQNTVLYVCYNIRTLPVSNLNYALQRIKGATMHSRRFCAQRRHASRPSTVIYQAYTCLAGCNRLRVITVAIHTQTQTPIITGPLFSAPSLLCLPLSSNTASVSYTSAFRWRRLFRWQCVCLLKHRGTTHTQPHSTHARSFCPNGFYVIGANWSYSNGFSTNSQSRNTQNHTTRGANVLPFAILGPHHRHNKTNRTTAAHINDTYLYMCVLL